ncbi:DUF1854 domain-containing protein [Comamonas sediminis]|uniref:cyanophycin metabolism-associated DUF1854 family protein n=1 Tax=Comamonas sediminis TaxID=1783360 RepID=UPI003D265CD6
MTSTHSPASLPLSRNAFGRLVFFKDGVAHQVNPVRAFPLSAPLLGISLVGEDGKEVLWIADMAAVDPAARALLDEDLAAREFQPLIERIVSVSTFSVPSIWTLETDRGPVQMTLKAEEDIRKLQGRQNLLITSADGVHYRLPDTTRLDKASRKLLERFL